ncbi:hypothetical protein D3C77_399990 [compost metagenome]
MADHAEQEQHQHQRANAAGGQFHCIHGVHACRSGQHCHRTEHERQARTQRRTQVGGPEGRRHTNVLRQVARIVRDIRSKGDLPERRQRYGGQPAGDVEAATGEEISGLDVGEDVAEAQHDAHAQHPGANTVEHMDEAVANDADDPRTQGANDDTYRHRHAVDHAMQRLAGQDDVGSEEADVHHPGNHHHQQCTQGAELGPALDHLRNAHLRALRRMQRHQHAADQMANEDGDDAPDQVQPEQLHAQGAGNNRQRRDVAAEPEGKQISHLSMAILWGHVSDRVFFDKRSGCCGGHDELQGKDEYVDVLRSRRHERRFLVGVIMSNARSQENY